MTDRIRVTIEPTEAQLEYDRPSEFTVTVQNLTGQVDAFDLSVVGLSPQYVRFDPPRLSKFPAPERSAAATLTVTIPTRAKVPARRHVVGVKAQSAVDFDLSRVEELQLDFPAVEALTLEAVPRLITSGGRGRFRVRAVNRGSVPKRIQLLGSDSEEAVTYIFNPPRLLVPPFGAVEAAVKVKARRPLSGGSVQRALTIRSVDSVGQSQETQATFAQRPLLRKPVIRMGAFGAIGIAAVTAFLLTRPQPIMLDDYRDQPQAEVEVDLARLDLQADVTTDSNPFVEKGLVIETTPAAGTEVNAGDKIIVVVSGGPELAGVPDLKGLTPAEVAEKVQQLQTAGFDVSTAPIDSPDVPRGQVIRTSPPAGDEVEAGDSIKVYISDGVEVPTVAGFSVPDASAELAKVGLTGEQSADRITDDETQDGLVADQNPAAGTRVSAPGTKIFLTVLKFEESPAEEPPTEGDS